MGLRDLFQTKMDVQLNMPPEKVRDIDSEIDWKIIDQLHNAVLNFSRNSMQAKKIMFTLLGIFMTAMLREPKFSIDTQWFLVIIGIVLLFWTFDSYTYYYQEKLRALMDERFKALKKRCQGTAGNDEYTLPDKRQKSCRLFRSIFNGSIIFYPTIIIGFVIWFLIEKGVLFI